MSATLVNSPPRRLGGRLNLLLGILAIVLGPVIYALQIQNHILFSPWYVPLLGTLGAVLITASLAQRRTVWRFAAAGLATLFAAFVWLVLLVGLTSPPYAGNVEVGRAFPSFETSLAGGAEFSQADLRGNQDTVLLFFRGRW